MGLKAQLRNYLRGYQRTVLNDPSNRIIILKARQIGISHVIQVRAILEAISTPYHDVIVASMSLREAKELIRGIEHWLEVFMHFYPELAGADCKKTQITLPNQSRIIALPALAIRSRSGTIILDEAAFIRRDREVWAALAPAVSTNPDLRIILISTPFGDRGIFHEIWTDPKQIYGSWSRHEIDIYRAAREGFPIDPDEIKKEYPVDIWEQEFCCKFGSDSDQYFSNDLILNASMDEDDMPEWSACDLYAGLDLAESVDATALSSILRQGSDDDAKRYLPAPQMIKAPGERRDLTEQWSDIEYHLTSFPYLGIGVDGAGVGQPTAKQLEATFEKVKIWQGMDWRQSAAAVMDLKRDMERGRFRIAADRDLARAFSRINKTERSDKTVAFSAPKDKHGHADRFFSALMGYEASRDDDGFVFLA